MIDAKGNVSSYTGPKATPRAGNKSCNAPETRCTTQGNIVANSAVIDSKNGGVWLHNDTVLRLQVDDNPERIEELRRLVEKAASVRQIPRAP